MWHVLDSELEFVTGAKIKVKVETLNIDQADRSEVKNLIIGHCREDGLGLEDWWLTK